ncbi:MAG: hypothetical protein V3V00_06985 [Saprospiraceae bacterium]
MRRVYILFVFLIGSQLSFGQSYSYGQYIEAAEKAMLNKDYYTALSHYNSAVGFGKSDIGTMYKAAEAARMFNAFNMATERYQGVLDSESNGEFPLASFWLGDVKQKMGNYEEAITSYDMYLSEHDGDDAYFTQKAQKEKKACEWAQSVVAAPDENITIEHLGEGVNTIYSDFAPVEVNDKLVFSSLRFNHTEVDNLPASQYSKILTIDGVNAINYNENINIENALIAHSAFNINKSRLFYTVCEYINVSDVRCDLYYRPVLGDGTLGDAIKLPESVNKSTATNTQPSIGFNEKMGKEVLYFVSDRDGGEGGMDIYSTTLDGGDTFGSVVNVGSVNTAGNDITPYFHNSSQVLYFSSDGYQNIGGYDIFRIALDDGTFGSAEHLGYPINSSYDDLYYSLREDSKFAHFSSNRMGAMYLEESEDYCCVSCYDIFKADIGDIKLDLNALTFDEETKASLQGATVRLINVATGEEVGLITNLQANDHMFDLEKGIEYKIIVDHPDYLPADPIYLSTMRSFRSESFVRKIYLEKAPNPYRFQVLTFHQLSRAALYGTTVTLTDLTDNSIQNVILTGSGTNEFNFEIIKGHSYRITGSKTGFYDASSSFVANYADGQFLLIKRLYLQTKIITDYLPLTLYFDNDIPDLRSTRTTTNKTYSQTYHNYIVRKEEFKNKYAESIEQPLGSEARNAVEHFFEDITRSGRYRNGVREGHRRLQQFLGTVLNELSAGKEFTISIRGYASPRAATKYNAALSQRRVESLKNEFRTYSGGVLASYLDNGKLIIEELAYGETTSAANISDRLYDLRNSVYSPEASQERRVEIERISVK